MKIQKWLSKKLEIRYMMLLVLFFAVILIAFGSLLKKHLIGNDNNSRLGRVVDKIASFPLLIQQTLNIHKAVNGTIFYVDNKFPALNGLKYYEAQNFDSGYLLTSYYNKVENRNTIDLVNLHNGSIIHRWRPPFEAIGKAINEKFKIDEIRMNHPIINKDGSVIANIWEKCVFKLDSNSQILWVTKGKFHHSVEMDLEGNIYSSLRLENTKNLNNRTGVLFEDAIAKLSPDGTLQWKKSIIDIFLENNQMPFLFGTGYVELDLIHLNEVKPASYNTAYWQKGDLLLSMRNKSTVLIYRPSNNKIIWMKSGPWMNQHSPDFVDSNIISVFGNDIVRSQSNDYLIRGHNNFYQFNLSDNSIDSSFADVFAKNDISSEEEGRAKLLENGDLFIEEKNSGRLIRMNKLGPRWVYINKIDDHYVSMVFWSRYLKKTGDCKFCLTEN